MLNQELIFKNKKDFEPIFRQLIGGIKKLQFDLLYFVVPPERLELPTH